MRTNKLPKLAYYSQETEEKKIQHQLIKNIHLARCAQNIVPGNLGGNY